MTLKQLAEDAQKLLDAGADPETPVYVSDSRNGETDPAGSPFITENKGYDAGGVLYEKAAKIVVISHG